MKRIAMVLVCVLLLLCSCANSRSADDIIDTVYGAVPADGAVSKYFSELETTALTYDNEEYYIGTHGIKYKSGAASESFFQPVTYSFVIIVLENDADYDAERKKIESAANKSKWVCDSADEMYVLRQKNVIALVMGSKAVCDEIEEAFYKISF